jgi:hypothetical protein
VRSRPGGVHDVGLRPRDIPPLNRCPGAVRYDASLPDEAALRPRHCTLVAEVMFPGSVTAGQTDKPAGYAAARTSRCRRGMTGRQGPVRLPLPARSGHRHPRVGRGARGKDDRH